mgnify:CR=1 FL=1
MILTVNIGNTHITVGGYEQDTLRFCGRLHSDTAATVDEYAIRLVNLLADKGKFGAFAYYCWAAGVLTLVLQGIK